MQVHVSPKHRMLGVPFREDVRNLYPEALTMEVGGAPHLLVPHGSTETYMLRKLGFEVPSPILTQYDWAGGEPFQVQKQTGALLTMNPRAYVLNGMGTGKTKAALWAWDYLRGNKINKKMLVAAPLSTLNFTWAREIFNTLPGVKCSVVHGGTRKRKLERLDDPDAEIFIINHDGLKHFEKEIIAKIDAGEIDTLVIDELATFRNTSERSKACKRISHKMKWVWGMTGSPIPNEPTDVWMQCQIVTPNTVPKYFKHFQQDLMVQVAPFILKPKHDAVERAFNVMQPAVRFTLDDVVELPDIIERWVDVDLAPSTSKIYRDLMQHCYSALSTGEITAANAGAVMMKLLQVSTGWVYKSDGTTATLDNSNRIDALMDAIASTDRKVLVFVPFKHALAGVSEALTNDKIEHCVVSGDTPAGQRSQLFNLFQNTGKYKVMAAHPQCLAHGITLTAADTVVWFAPITSLEIYDQANHRIRRVGQQHKQQIIHLQATPVEKKIYTMLRGKQKVQDMMLSLFEQSSKDFA
jgi:SNF2 family DNA or RNA helicase